MSFEIIKIIQQKLKKSLLRSEELKFSLGKELISLCEKELNKAFPNVNFTIFASSDQEIIFDGIDNSYYDQDGGFFEPKWDATIKGAISFDKLTIIEKDPPVPLNDLRKFFDEFKIKSGIQYSIRIESRDHFF